MGKQFVKSSFLIAFLFFLAFNASSQVTIDWKEHKVSDKLFIIKYPPTWKLNDSTNDAVFYITSPKETSSDEFDENFNLQYRDLSDGKLILRSMLN